MERNKSAKIKNSAEKSSGEILPRDTEGNLMKSVAQTIIEADRFYTIAAKTGTAETSTPDENGNKPTEPNLSFICYAPANDPQIAIGIIMEHGGKSVYAANVAKAIMDGYFHPETMPEVE